jgi:SAM-dependent methyltransferase
MAIGWNHPDTARYYESFCRRHPRYRAANAALAAHAEIPRDARVLDVAAGTGRTAEAALRYLGPQGRVICLEPAEAMRAAGSARLRDPRLSWVSDWPQAHFDRVLCGAGIWQMTPLEETFRRVAGLLSTGGLFAFNIPSLYLGRPDAPGGGRDPYLLELPSLLAAGRVPAAEAWPPSSALDVEAAVAAAGFHAERWHLRQRFTQQAFRDWLKVPVLTDALLPELDAAARARRIERAYRSADPFSWRWEAWYGWTAWLHRNAAPERLIEFEQ